VCTIHLAAIFYGGSSGLLGAVNDSVQSLRSVLPYQHGGVEKWTFRAVLHGSLQSSTITNYVTTMDVIEGEGGLEPVVFFVLIIVGLFGVHAPLPFHPSLTTATYTTTTVKLI